MSGSRVDLKIEKKHKTWGPELLVLSLRERRGEEARAVVGGNTRAGREEDEERADERETEEE